jgi:hypothetical protein
MRRRLSTASLWMLQDKRQVDRSRWESPSDTEIASCPLGVTIGRRANAIVAVLDGQHIGSTVGVDQVIK